MDNQPEKIDVSVVLPCRNEMAALPACLEQIIEVFKLSNLVGEIIVSDSSSDQSPEIARRYGAVLIKHDCEGYGVACRQGLAAACGQYIFLADADGSYDFREIPNFINKLTAGSDFVIGNRFGGKIETGSMPWLHRYIGNPLLSSILRFLFHAQVTDVHCGLRAISRQALNQITLYTSGMEFASEMVIQAVKKNLQISELPISYHSRKGKSKLKPLADGWRHLRFMLLYSPLFLFLVPGLIFFSLGLVITFWIYGNFPFLFGRHFSYHPMFLGLILIISGYQLMFFALFAKTYAIIHLGDSSKIINFIQRHITIEKASLLGTALVILGSIIFVFIFWKWYQNNFGALEEIKNSIMALTFMVVGLQTIFSSFMLSILGIQEK
ncbi:MAG: glycosyltransferase family 2 protein [Patescibacteria group bacterium]|nr:glycosyltransferase family 2 protein [Patescibacteria group bacterium]